MENEQTIRLERLRVGLVGCGAFGINLGRFIRQTADIVSLCDLEEAQCRRTAFSLGLEPAIYTDYQQMFARERLDAVFITTANFSHAEISVAAANAGVHIFCEKVMARTVPECWTMVSACQSAKVKMMVGHKRRLRPHWARMIELTRDNEGLGEPLSITIAQYADRRSDKFMNTWWGDPALSGGFFSLHCPHALDWLRAMCGDARRVWGMYGPQLDSRYRYRDVVTIVIEFINGATATVAGSLAFPLHKYRESQGPIGQTRNGGFKLVPQMSSVDLYWQRLNESDPHCEHFDDLGYDHAFQLEVNDFISWITRDKTPCLTWIEGLRCVELMEAAIVSAEEGGKPVELPLYPELEQKFFRS